MFKYRVRHLDSLGDLVWEEFFRDLDSALFFLGESVPDAGLKGDSFSLDILY